MSEILKLAVVGHTNVGKTSLLRTLTRDAGFGEVSHRAGTTRHVEGALLSVAGEPLLALYDTPGLEDAMALRDCLDSLSPASERLDGPARLQHFLDSPEAQGRFEQEARVLRQLLACDAGLYVIDAREPVLAKYRDELAILAAAGKPLLPVLNFVAGEDHRSDTWRDALARLGLHALVRFDSVAPPREGEQRLYESLALLIEPAAPRLQRLLAEHALQRQQRRQAATCLIAELLVDAAACRRLVDSQPAALNTALEQLRDDLRQREQRCVEALLALYAFEPGTAEAATLPLSEGRWESDLFHPHTLRQLGVQLGGGMAAGAAAGVGIDLLLGGLTLGAAAALGAVAGGTWQTLRNYGERLRGTLRGQRELTVDDAILRLLALRQRQLLDALQHRGHAAQSPLQQEDPHTTRWREGRLPPELEQARTHPRWSALNDALPPADGARQRAIETLSQQLLAGLD